MGSCCCSPRAIISEVAIEGSSEIVRNVFLDGDTFGEWNPLYKYFRVVKGDFDNTFEFNSNQGEKIIVETEVTINNARATLEVLENTPHRLSWKTTIIHSSFLTATITNDFQYNNATNTTIYHREESFVGCFAGIAMCFSRPAIQGKADAMALSLKSRVQSKA